MAQNRHAITGERFSGCPAYYPPRLSDGDIDRVYPAESWPLKLMSFKSHVMSSSTTMIERLQWRETVKSGGDQPGGRREVPALQHGICVRITTPGGSVEAQISLLTGGDAGVVGD